MCFDSNYENDFRVQGGQNRWWKHINESNMKATIVLVHTDEETDEMVEEEFEIPIIFEICSTCRGSGTHVNPNIDCHGLTQQDFDEDPDFREEYMGGNYDVSCYECYGKRVAPRIDEANADKEVLRKFRQRQEDERNYRRECAAERRMGA